MIKLQIIIYGITGELISTFYLNCWIKTIQLIYSFRTNLSFSPYEILPLCKPGKLGTCNPYPRAQTIFNISKKCYFKDTLLKLYQGILNSSKCINNRIGVHAIKNGIIILTIIYQSDKEYKFLNRKLFCKSVY